MASRLTAQAGTSKSARAVTEEDVAKVRRERVVSFMIDGMTFCIKSEALTCG